MKECPNTMHPHLDLVKELAKVEKEIFEMSHSSYSQSNPAHVLGLRSLHRRRDRLRDQLKQAKLP